MEADAGASSSASDACAAVSVHSLRVELLRRGLETGGVKRALCARLAAARAAEAGGPRACASVPRRFPRRGAAAAAARRRAADAADAARATKRARVDAVGTIVAGAIWVTGVDAMDVVWDVADGYGKGSLSRSEPVYAAAAAGRQAAKAGRAARQLLALETAANANANTHANGNANGSINANADPESHAVPQRADDVEHLQLTLVEGFHAAFETRLIRLVAADGTRLDDMLQVWHAFCLDDPLFASTYSAYVFYRRAGWMPRSGLKYGVDWVLYRAGLKRHTHAPYCIILSYDGGGLQQSWIRLQNKLRLVKNVAKILVTTQVTLDLPDPQLPPSPSAAVAAVKLTELTVDRWVS